MVVIGEFWRVRQSGVHSGYVTGFAVPAASATG
jgi:hypothetical protein